MNAAVRGPIPEPKSSPPAPQAKPPTPPAAAAAPPPNGSAKILRTLDDYPIEAAAALPAIVRSTGPDRPLDSHFEAMRLRVIELMGEGKPGIAEKFIPKWFFDDRRRDAGTEITEAKMKDNIKRWFVGWQNADSRRANLKCSTYYRDPSKPGSTRKEPGVSVFLEIRPAG